MNARVLESFGLLRGVSHTEFIRSHDGELYFLETSARVGGAYIVDVVEAATGINLWREWARIEIAGEYGTYTPPLSKGSFAGIVLSLARQEEPDLSAYTDPEIVTRVKKRHHAGLIVSAADEQRVADAGRVLRRRASTPTSTPLNRHPTAPPTDGYFRGRNSTATTRVAFPSGFHVRKTGSPAIRPPQVIGPLKSGVWAMDRPRRAWAPWYFATRSPSFITKVTGRPGGHSTRWSSPSTRCSPVFTSR